VNEYIVGLVSALLGALGTLGVAVLRARGKEKENTIEAARVANKAQERAIETLQQRLDMMETRLDDAESAEQRCRERLREEREERERLEGTVEQLQEGIQELHRRYDALAGRIEQDSDIDWDPHTV